MENRFRNLYRISSNRLKSFDYSSPGYYFVTICTKEQKNYFGEIKDHIMKLSNIGHIVQKSWNQIPDHFSFAKLDEFVIMPNHIHGVLNISALRVETRNLHVSTQLDLCVNTRKQLGVIINQFKRTCTISCGQIWQPRFYDHIIRHERSLYAIREYIKNNPMNWEKDRENIKGQR